MLKLIGGNLNCYMHLHSPLALKAGEMNIFRESCTVLLRYIVLSRPVDLTESVMHS